jgi:hypothetical protein
MLDSKPMEKRAEGVGGMPRYFFHCSTGDGDPIRDETGSHFVDDNAARQHAERIAGELAEPKAGQEDSSWQGWSIRVVDEAGRDVFSVPVRLK